LAQARLKHTNTSIKEPSLTPIAKQQISTTRWETDSFKLKTQKEKQKAIRLRLVLKQPKRAGAATS